MNTIEKEGAWCWFADPRAIRCGGKTFVGCIDVHGNIKAVMIEGGKKTSVLVRSNFQPDDHDNPTFLVLPNGRIMIIYSRHTDEPCFYYRISREPYDITRLGSEKKLVTDHNTTYPSLFILSDDPDKIYLCYRGVNWHPTCAVLSLPDENDDIEFIKKPFQIVHSLIQGGGCRPYAKYASDGKSKIHLVYSATHPDNLCPVPVYYSCLDAVNDRLLDAEGGVLKEHVSESPFVVTGRETDPAFVVDDYTTSERGWVWDAALRGSSVAAATVRISEDKLSQKCYYTYYEDGAWKKVFLAMGRKFHKSDIEYCYGGGMCLDRDEDGVIYASVPMGTSFEIQKYTVSGGAVKREAVTKKSVKNNIRPYKISGGALMWLNGDYYYWIVNSRFPEGFPTSIIWDGEALSEKYGGDEVRVCASDSGELYKKGGVTLSVDGFDVYLNGFKSENPLSTSDWNREHDATTDGSKNLVRPNETVFEIIESGGSVILLRDGAVDICIKL